MNESNESIVYSFSVCVEMMMTTTGTSLPVQYSSDVLCYGKVFTVRYCTVVNGDALCVVIVCKN